MADRPQPVFRTAEEVLLVGTMAIYNSQAEASESIPKQWREFQLTYPALGSNSKFYGASPCTDDRKIHYLAGVAQKGPEVLVRGERLTLAAGQIPSELVQITNLKPKPDLQSQVQQDV
jgi:hypothetical protein